MSFLGSLFGGNQVQAPQIKFNPTGFGGGGLFGGFNPATNNYSISPDASRTSAVQGVQSTFGNQAADIGNLRSQFTPGFSNLRQSLMTELQNNRTQAMGNLRDNLAQRRVLGSSFAQNSLANADQTYQQQIQQVQAQTFLQELSAQQQLQQQQYAAARGQFQTGLDEMNLEAGLASELTKGASTALANVANAQAKLDLDAQTTNAKMNQDNLSGFGSLLGSIGGSVFGPVGSAIGGKLAGSLFS